MNQGKCTFMFLLDLNFSTPKLRPQNKNLEKLMFFEKTLFVFYIKEEKFKSLNRCFIEINKFVIMIVTNQSKRLFSKKMN